MTELVTYSDGSKMGTFAQLKLEDGSRILISLTQTEIAVMKLFLGSIPTGKIFEHNIGNFLSFFTVRVKNVGPFGSLLEALVDDLMRYRTKEAIVKRLEDIVAGSDNPEILEEIEKQMVKKMQAYGSAKGSQKNRC